jgi:hypothetical protein
MSNRTTIRSRHAAVTATLLLLAFVCPYASDALAEKNVPRTIQHVSKDDLKKACKKAGGEFSDLGTDYTCVSKKGDVACNQKKCTGSTKDAPGPATPRRLTEVGSTTEQASPEADQPVLGTGGQSAEPFSLFEEIQ